MPGNMELGAAFGTALSPLRSDRTRKRFRPIRVTILALKSPQDLERDSCGVFVSGTPEHRRDRTGGGIAAASLI